MASSVLTNADYPIIQVCLATCHAVDQEVYRQSHVTRSKYESGPDSGTTTSHVAGGSSTSMARSRRAISSGSPVVMMTRARSFRNSTRRRVCSGRMSGHFAVLLADLGSDFSRAQRAISKFLDTVSLT